MWQRRLAAERLASLSDRPPPARPSRYSHDGRLAVFWIASALPQGPLTVTSSPSSLDVRKKVLLRRFWMQGMHDNLSQHY